MSGSDSSEMGNRLVFKPSPLQALRAAGSEPARTAGPLEVTAAPLANARRPDRAHEDLTTFSTAPLPTPPPPPAVAPAEAPVLSAQPETPSAPKPTSSLTWLVLIATALAALLLVATMWPESLGLR